MNASEPEAFAPTDRSAAVAPHRPRIAALRQRSSRFVTQSHALGVSRVRPRALLIAAGIAVFLYLLGRRLSE